MDRTSSGAIMLVAGALLVVGGGYAFMNLARGGVNPVSVGSFAALVVGIVLVILGKSRLAAGSQEELAGAVGLEVKSGFGLSGTERVEMEGEFDGFKVKVSRRETHTRGGLAGGHRYNEAYVFTVELPNPAGLAFYVGSDSIFQTPIGFLPPKLEARAWEWVDFMTVRGMPAAAAETFFGNSAAWPLFKDFFGRFACRLDGETMEFEPETRDGDEGFYTPEEIKGFINQAVAVARLAAALPPAAPRPD